MNTIAPFTPKIHPSLFNDTNHDRPLPWQIRHIATRHRISIQLATLIAEINGIELQIIPQRGAVRFTALPSKQLL